MASSTSDPSTEASAIADPFTTTSVRAYHVLKIDGHSRTSDIQFLDSCPFHAGGRAWCIRYYPRGTGAGNANFMSFFLVLIDVEDDDDDDDVIAQATFSLLDQDRKPVASHATPMANFSELVSYGFHYFIERECLERSELMQDDCFAIRVGVHVVKKKSPPSMVPPSNLRRHLGDLLSSNEGADVEFRVGESTFPAHRLVLAARSSVFRAELFVPKEKSTNIGVIQIDDMEAHVFRALLTFIYTDTWPEMDHEDECAMAQHLLVAADRYRLQRLKLMCEDRLCSHIDTSSVANVLAIAEKHRCLGLKKACFEFLGSLTVLRAVIGTKEFVRLARGCPAMTKELIFNVLDRGREKGIFVGCDQERQCSVIKIPI